MKAAIQRLLPEIIKIRHQIHEHPELCYQEVKTAALVADTLKKFGYEITTNIGVTGISALLDSGKPGKTVALRADMDALPLQEHTSLSYQSKNPGKMHACGHDGHTATLLAVAGVLKEFTKDFKGKIKFIFQPAEEGGAGAAAMIKDGILDNPKVDAIFGYHNMPQIPFGSIGTKTACLMAAMDTFIITVTGKGGHAAEPETAIDPILIGAQIVQGLQSIASRFTSPTEPIVLTITQFHGGTAYNIIPEDVTLHGTLRTTSVETRAAAKQHMTEIAANIAQAFGATASVNFKDSFPPTINHAIETDFVLNTAGELLGEKNSQRLIVPMMTSEDFSYFLEKVPGCFFFVGCGKADMSLHNPHFDFNDDIIPIAAEMMGRVAMRYLNLDK